MGSVVVSARDSSPLWIASMMVRVWRRLMRRPMP
jgi:hypothetical protein